MMAVCHYAAMYYPARVLGDRELWPKLREELIEEYASDTPESAVIAQWEPCVLYDQTARLPECRVPLHVVVFGEDVQAVPQDGEEVVALCPTAELHLFEGMGHCSLFGHTQDVLNPFIRGIVERYLQARGERRPQCRTAARPRPQP
jgi:pimeloyl-ACP methyl ester carboxylesterase